VVYRVNKIWVLVLVRVNHKCARYLLWLYYIGNKVSYVIKKEN